MSIIIIGNKSPNNLDYFFWREVLSSKDIDYISDVCKSGFYKLFFNSITFKYVVTVRIKKWLDKTFMTRLLYRAIPEGEKCLIFSSHSFFKIGKKYLYEYKQRNNSVIVLFLYDSLKTLPQHYQTEIMLYKEKGVIDFIYSFDKDDCRLFHFHFWQQLYSPIIRETPPIVKYDLYFAGRNKGRYEMLVSIVNRCKKSNVNAKIRMPNLSFEQKKYFFDVLGKSYDEKMLTYEKTLNEMFESNCILEILQTGQHGITWRMVEAIVYNKKLLTNNQDVLNSKYYSTQKIQYFKNVDEIDFNWISEKKDIEYSYAGEFSPKLFIENLKGKIK